MGIKEISIYFVYVELQGVNRYLHKVVDASIGRTAFNGIYPTQDSE